MADVAQGTVIKWGGTVISEITNFSGLSISHDAVDVANLSSTSKPYLAAGIYDVGECTIDVNFDADTAIHDQMVDDCIAGQGRVLLIEFQNTGTAATNTYTCNAFVTNFTPSGSTGEKLEASYTIKGNGALTIA